MRVVTKVRIHKFEIHFFLTWRREHVRSTQGYWSRVEFILAYINRGPWVEEEGKKVRAVNITFDDFMRPVIEAWKADLLFAELIHQIPEYKTNLITSYYNLDYVHQNIGALVEGFSLELEYKVNIAYDDNEEGQRREDYEILMFHGFPYLPPF